MKTSDLVQLGALATIGYLAYQKFGAAHGKSTSIPSLPLQPSTQVPDFGLSDPNDSTWGEADGGMTTLQRAIDWALMGSTT